MLVYVLSNGFVPEHEDGKSDWATIPQLTDEFTRIASSRRTPVSVPTVKVAVKNFSGKALKSGGSCG